MCKHRFGVQLLHNPPLCSSTLLSNCHQRRCPHSHPTWVQTWCTSSLTLGKNQCNERTGRFNTILHKINVGTACTHRKEYTHYTVHRTETGIEYRQEKRKIRNPCSLREGMGRCCTVTWPCRCERGTGPPSPPPPPPPSHPTTSLHSSSPPQLSKTGTKQNIPKSCCGHIFTLRGPSRMPHLIRTI